MKLSILSVLCLGLAISCAMAAPAEPPSAASYREEIRNKLRSRAAPFRNATAPAWDDAAAELVDKLQSSNLAEMERLGLLQARLETSPWSDSYWPTYVGQLANRYLDPGFFPSSNWRDNNEYLEANLGKGEPNRMSPAEKYDLLVGDPAFTLSRRMMRAGMPYADANGAVESWFGLCHGWAAAAFMLPRPVRAVKVRGAAGEEITFLPADIKALGTLLWASAPGRMRFVGGRCNERIPKRGPEGREVDDTCRDTNPATWHVAVVNQIGLARRSFVMDTSEGFEVWNQPVLGYSYSYVNPLTGESFKELARAKMSLGKLRRDPYRAHRSPHARSVVQVVMSVTYVAENGPLSDPTDSPEQDMLLSATYHYDLELDADDNIVGGEWHGSRHPDFLWVPEPGSRARSMGDLWLDSQGGNAAWDGQGELPASWRSIASLASARDQPLARVVEKLFELAQ